jgi:hypothetical protein
MEIRIQVIVDNDERTRRDIARWDRTSLASGTLGLHSMRQGLFSMPVRRHGQRSGGSLPGRTGRLHPLWSGTPSQGST